MGLDEKLTEKVKKRLHKVPEWSKDETVPAFLGERREIGKAHEDCCGKYWINNRILGLIDEKGNYWISHTSDSINDGTLEKEVAEAGFKRERIYVPWSYDELGMHPLERMYQARQR